MTEQVDTPRLVQALRNRTGLTQEQFAARLGVTFPTVSRWEHGRARPSPLALRQIEALLRELREEGHDLLETYFGQEERDDVAPAATFDSPTG
jgi:putative transcriptional regulator